MRGLLEGILVGVALLLAFLLFSAAVYLWRYWANGRIALNVALGRYQNAIRVAGTVPKLLDPATLPDEIQILLRINACEALVELGQIEEASRF
ncbi:MAG: hypothetical protein Q8N26_27400 [Myxococcales bacterium]|nr:hypothetical protein [Myxococcales bacterium]